MAMVIAAIQRVRLHEVLEEKEIECLSNLVVIGGGVAGIEAALAAARAGREVTLIDSAPSIGGSFWGEAPGRKSGPHRTAFGQIRRP